MQIYTTQIFTAPNDSALFLRVLRQGSPTAFKSRLTQFARQSNRVFMPNDIY